MTPKRSMRPITTAPSARSRKVGPRTVPMGSPTAPARSHIPRNASTVATVHTIVCRRRTGMPSVDARSARSALPRTATPMLLSRSHAASAMNAIGIITIAITSLPLKMVLPTWNLTVERRVEPVGLEVLAERLGDEQPGGDEDLREADRGDGEDQSRRLEEPADDQGLDEDAEHDGGDEPGGEGEEVVDAQADHEQDAERRRHLPEVALGEVDDPVRPVDRARCRGR